MFAVANSALINMLMASRLVYGMSREGVLPPIFGRVHRRRRTPWTAIVFTSLLAFGLITFVGAVPALGGTRSEEHTSELQSLMRISSTVFCLNKNNNHTKTNNT